MLVLYPQQQLFNSSGGVLSGGKVFFYQPGTSTPKSVFSDSTGTTALTNPVILDSSGRASMWLNGVYKVIIQDSNGVQVSSTDNVSFSPYQTLVTSEWVLQSLTSLTYISATQFSCTSDQTPTFQINRRVQITVSAGTIYGIITASFYAAGVTTVTVALDSGVLDAGLSAVSVGILATTNPSYPLKLGSLTVPLLDIITKGPYVDVRAYGAKGDGITDDTVSIQNAINGGKGLVYIPATASFYLFTTLTIPAETTFYGDGLNKTILKSATTGNAITITGHRVNIKDMTIQQSGIVQGKGIVCDNAYWFKTQNVLVTGFAYNLYGAKTLYHEHDNSRFENGTYGVYYYGIAGVWNTDWFNNVITFTNCRFLNNTNTNAYIKGSQIVMVNPDYSTGGSIGLNILGDSVGYPCLGFTIIDPYVELTPIAFSFSYARGRIVGGYAQGNTIGSPYTSVLDLANSSVVDIIGLQTFSYWTWKYRATVNSILNVYGALWQGAGGTESVDGTSYSSIGGLSQWDLTLLTAGTVYGPAATNRMVYINATSGLSVQVLLYGITDAANPPTTVVIQNSNPGISGGTQVIGISFLVKKGHYFKFTLTGAGAVLNTTAVMSLGT